jgi:hypothetical protein
MDNNKLTKEELEITRELSNKRLQYILKLGEIKLSEIENEKAIKDIYFNLTELNTREEQFKDLLREKYGNGEINFDSYE